jgi:peptidoglycan hydrolase-like protein with peptidoglycan-binding domain
VLLEVGEGIEHGPVYLSKLVYGQDDSDSVRRLQLHLNAHPLTGGEQLPVTGNYADQTDEEVRLCQGQHGFGSDPAGGSSVGPTQAAHLFTGCACTINDDTSEEVPPVTASGDYWYSGKPAGTLTFADSYKRLDVDKWAPPRDGTLFGMLYANITGGGEIRVRLIRDPDDATAYQTFYPQAGDNFLLTHVWFEAAEAGRPLWWEFQSMDGTAHTVGTRYAKFTMID